MRKILFCMFAVSMIFVSCKSQPKTEKEQPAVEEAAVEETVTETVEEKVVETVKDGTEFIINFPPDMKKVDVLMANKLDSVAEAIKTRKPETVTFVGYTAQLNTTREEEKAVDKVLKLMVNYLEGKGALDDVKIVTENKGAAEPISSNDITERARNRRVRITLK